MKSIILMTFFLGLISMNCLSQDKNNLIFDSSILDLKITLPDNNLKKNDFKINYQTGKSTKFDKLLMIPELKTIKKYDLQNNLAMSENQNSFDNMPCIKPKINSFMPIIVPDSNSKYTLLIKKNK